MNLKGRSFLTLLDFNKEEIRYMLDLAHELKAKKKRGELGEELKGKNIVLIFDKSSTRTRCSFEVGAVDEGAHVTYLSNSHMNKKESLEDSAKVFGRMYDAIEYRGFGQDIVEDLARYSGVPVWNGLTDVDHPTQVLADFMTIEEKLGGFSGKTLAFVGDTRNNVANSLMAMSAKMGVNFIACGPESLKPSDEVIAECTPVAEKNGCTITVTSDLTALEGKADAIYTDIWLSMGEDKEKWGERISLLKPYQVTMELMNRAKPTTVFLHCLPSFHDLNTKVALDVNEKFGLTEMEVTDEVFNSERSIVFDEAENRMHTIKTVMFLTLYKKEEK